VKAAYTLPDHGSSFLGLQLRTGGELDYSDPAFSNPFGVEPDEEVWQPEGASYYRKLILQPQQHWTREEQLELLDYHPMFTGSCPQCELPFPGMRGRRCIGTALLVGGLTIRCEMIA
jgi:hypothetical protein